MLPYDTGICCYAFIYYFLSFFPVHSFFIYTFKKSGIDKSMEWSTIPACPGFMCFFNTDNTEGTNSSKILFLIFVYVFCNFVSGLILWVWDNLWFDDLRAE